MYLFPKTHKIQTNSLDLVTVMRYHSYCIKLKAVLINKFKLNVGKIPFSLQKKHFLFRKINGKLFNDIIYLYHFVALSVRCH